MSCRNSFAASAAVGGGDEIEGIVRFCRREAEGIVAGVADVIAHFAREIKEDADALAAIGRGR